ncbi:MAG: hypothetical protein KGN00_11165 [Chloroflexota bacterium]|nr:hypothetical protein [Chloroflexota bacterium]MDE3194236.1 hypothetical protein [Chloroflexota bacterium]
MSAEQLHEILDRAMSDAAFRELLARDADAALKGYDLTAEERAKFGSGTARVERLEPRVSKSDLSAGLGVKTGTVDIRPPSQSIRKR